MGKNKNYINNDHFKKTYFYLCICRYTHVHGCGGENKKLLDLLQLKLQVIASHLIWLLDVELWPSVHVP